MKTSYRICVRIAAVAGILLLSALPDCFAAQPYTPVQSDPLLEPWRWQSFPELAGLGLRCVAEDRDGNMWFGVADGAMRYDGVNWTSYTPEDGLLGGQVSTFLATPDGSLYAGTRWGISRFSDGAWQKAFPPEGDLPWPIFSLKAASDGGLWAATAWGALRLDRWGTTLYTSAQVAIAMPVLAPDVQLVIVPDEAVPQRPWMEGAGIGVVIGDLSASAEIPGIIWTLASGGPGEAAGLNAGDCITAVNGQSFFSPRQLGGPAGGTVALTVQRGGDAFDVTVTLGQIEGTYRDFQVFDVCETPEAAVWFGLRQGEMIRYDTRSAQPEDPAAWRLYTEEDGLDIHPRSVRSPVGDSSTRPRILQTQDGILWMVSHQSTRGVNRFDGKTWTHVSLADLGGVNLNTSILETADGTVWVSGWSTLHAYRNGTWRVYTAYETSIPFLNDHLLESSDGALWLAIRGREAVRLDYGTARWTTYEGLAFQCETPDGARWFVSQDSAVVRYDGNAWTRYGVEDGLMDFPAGLTSTREGVLWAAGSHDGAGATARFDGRGWFREVHPEVSSGLWGGYGSLDGAFWVSARWPKPGREYRLGMLCYDGKTWTHYTARDGALSVSYGMAQTADGTLWFGGTGGLRRFDGQTWTRVEEMDMTIHTLYSSPGGDLWVGTRTDGAFRYDGQAWTQYDVRDGLADNEVNGVYQTEDGSVWIRTLKGISRFDGQAWTTHVFPPGLVAQKGRERIRRIGLQASRDGALWINRGSRRGDDRRVTRYMPDSDSPVTEITLSLSEVSQPGNTTLAWEGTDLWRSTPDADLQYAYRLDGDEWSPFSGEKIRIFEALSSGEHTFEVKARDRDFNEDPTPALVRFTVVPPVWQQGWFIAMVVAFIGGIGFQTSRVIRRDRRLHAANAAMSSANRELFQVNVDLQREQVLERLRGQAQGMQSSEDIGPVVEAVYRELKALGLPMIQSAIDIMISDTEKEEWSTAEDGHALDPVIVKRPTSKNPALQTFQRGDDYFHHHFDGKGRKEEIRQVIADGVESRSTDLELGRIFGNPRWKGIPEDRWPQEAECYTVFFDGGYISLVSEAPIAEEYLVLIKRFGEVFEYAHARWEELKAKEAQNRRLAVDASVQRLRAEVQSMDEARDFEHILSLLTEGLRVVELSFDGCEIDVLDEPVENPTMDLFETKGFRYTTYTLDASGHVASNTFALAAPFPAVNRRTIERFIAGEPWQGTSDGEAIVEVPVGSYGRLRLTASGRDGFTDDEVAILREFAGAVALGYARYLDIREIQLNTERKSAFLASMSHELRTPLNAIKGFTNLVLRRIGGDIPDRQRGNLEKVDQASDHLLAMINDLLDLSKIEAGRMDANPERFDVTALVASCCDTVSPLVQEGVELKRDVATNLDAVHTDKARLQQMIINLLSNAIKFTASGSVTVKAAQLDDQLVVSVTDTGKGIREAEIPTLFDEYRQVRGQSESNVQKGTGLGLSITRKFAELLGGSIRVASEVGKGSVFTVCIPMRYGD